MVPSLTPYDLPFPKDGVPYAPTYANGHVSTTGDPIHFMFGFRVGFSGTADRTALFTIRTNPRWRPPTSWIISNGHMSATAHDLLIRRASRGHLCDSTAFLLHLWPQTFTTVHKQLSQVHWSSLIGRRVAPVAWPLVHPSNSPTAQLRTRNGHFRSCALSALFCGPTPTGRNPITEASRRRFGPHVTIADSGIHFRSRKPPVYCACPEFTGSAGPLWNKLLSTRAHVKNTD